MATAYHETLHSMGNLGIKVSIGSVENPHLPLHWHEAMEILFCLNGEVTVQIENETFDLSRNQLIVFDSRQVHSVHLRTRLYMFLCVHIDKNRLSVYCPDLEMYKIKCHPVSFEEPKGEHYFHLCQLAHDLTRIQIKDEKTSAMLSDGTVLLMLSDLINYFSTYSTTYSGGENPRTTELVREIISYVTQNYQEQITLDFMAHHVGFSKEYFCRFFKKHVGITFLQYLSEVRISNAGHLLATTDLSISEIMQEVGFTNQTIFNRLFKEIYGMTPRQIRKIEFPKR